MPSSNQLENPTSLTAIKEWKDHSREPTANERDLNIVTVFERENHTYLMQTSAKKEGLRLVCDKQPVGIIKIECCVGCALADFIDRMDSHHKTLQSIAANESTEINPNSPWAKN